MPTVAPISAAQVTETIAQRREVLGALRAAYTDQALMPSDTKDLIVKLEAEIERLEKEFTKATTKNLHSATKALGKAQKTLTETLEAKRVHRARWTKHVAEAAKTWEGQLHEYRQQQSSFQEVATKARADIESARSAIQTLSAKATPATLAAMPPIAAITAETEDLTGGRQRRGICATTITEYSQKLCGLLGRGFDSAIDLSGCPRRDGRECTERSSSAKAPSIHGTFRKWWWWLIGLAWGRSAAVVNEGGALLVHCNSLHGANIGVPGADAYVCMPSTCAACPWEPHPFLHDINPSWHQYVNAIPSDSHVFAAIRSACGLRWNVLCESFHEQLECLNRIHYANDDLHLDSDFIEEESCQAPQIPASCQRSHVVATQVFPEMLHRSKIHEKPGFMIVADGQTLKSCIRMTDGSAFRQKRVQFLDQIQIHIGLDDELVMGSTTMHHDTLFTWGDKPWSRRKCRDTHSSSPLFQFRTTDEFYNVPSRWPTQHTNAGERDVEDIEDANHFLHEAPESVQYLFDAMLSEGVVEGPRIHECFLAFMVCTPLSCSAMLSI